MVVKEGDRLQGAADSGADPGATLPLVACVNFRELQRGSRATLARVLGVSRSAVGKAIAAGRIQGPGSDGLLDLRASVAAWARNTHPGRVRARALRSVAEEAAALRARIASLENDALAHRNTLASENARERAVSVGLQDRAAMAVARMAENLAGACARLADAHSPQRIRAALESGALAWLVVRAAGRSGLYDLSTAPMLRAGADE